MRAFFTAFLLCTFVTSTVSAATTSTFNIRVFGAADIVAPTTPTLLLATPITTDQIDVTWSGSTDNFIVSGYVVFRGGVAVATTTLTNYSDIGLNASTTYSYSVRAFDPSFNYSSSSNALTTTTPGVPIPPTSTAGGTQSTLVGLELDKLTVVPGISTSTFYIKTTRPARFEMRWGRTTSYELGYTVNNKFTSSYETTLTNLEPGTLYEYEVVGYSVSGKAYVLERGHFTTLRSEDALPPANVNRFRATAEGTDVRLTWEVPAGEGYQYIRVVRNHLGYPTSLQDGAVVYQGVGQSFTDSDILKQYSPVYYTAFVVDASGNVSSGAVAKVYATDDGKTIGGTKEGNVTEAPASSSSDGFTPGKNIPTGTRMPDASEVFLLQENTKQTFADQNIAIDSHLPFTLSIPKNAVSDNLKTIIVTFTDPTDSRLTSSFLLRINKDRSAYEAVIAPLDLDGVSRLTIDIYDYDAAVVGTFQKTINFKGVFHATVMPIFPDRILFELKRWGPLAALPILFGILIFFYRRRQHHQS